MITEKIIIITVICATICFVTYVGNRYPKQDKDKDKKDGGTK